MSTKANIEIARIYIRLDEAREDGTLRVLVDRLWPRGVSKERAAIDLWAKDVTPSDELRKSWHDDPDGHSPKHFYAFKAAYEAELREEPARTALAKLASEVAKAERTLLFTSAKNPDISHVPVLLKALKRRA